MKSFGRLLAISRRFYLCVLAIVTIFVLMDCIYICNDCGISLTKTSVEQYVENTLTREDGESMLETRYINLASTVIDKGNNVSLMGLWVTMAGIIVLLFVRAISFADDRTQEFRTTWPVKGWVREVYDYLALLGIIIFGIVLETVILYTVQVRYNDLFLNVLGEHGIVSRVTEFMSQSPQNLLVNMGYYLICLIAAYTWIYLGMSLAKNVLAGAAIALIVKGVLAFLCETFVWEIVTDVTMLVTAGNDEMANYVANEVSDIGFSVVSGAGFFWLLDLNQSLDGGYDTFTITHWIVIQLVLCVLMVAGIIISAKKKDLSKGKLLYFPILDYPLAFVTGIGFYAFLTEFLCWDYSVISFIASAILAIVTYILIHPISRNNMQRLEVK